MTAGLADRAARDRIATDLDATLFVEAGAGSGKTRSLVDRIVALVRAGVQMRDIAAITFTEKAAAELRDRVRHALEQQLAGDPDGPFRVALEQLDAAAISTLHAFAQRILTEHPIEARLPPDVEVLDEVASQIEFEHRWRQFRDRLLNDPLLERTLLLAMATDVTLDDLRHLARVLGDNWDLVADKQRLPWDRGEPPISDASDIVERIATLLDRIVECRDSGDKLCVHLSEQVAPYLEQLRAAPDEYEVLRLLRAEQPRLIYQRKGSRTNWRDHASVLREMAEIGRCKDALAGTIAVRALQRLALEVADFTLASAEERRASGRLEFHDLLVLARELLRDDQHGVDVRRALRRRYRRLLLDEFQDTDPIQIDLAVLIASDDPGAAAAPWSDVAAEPGRLFFVGDPKQSIYRFRRADIEVFLEARDTFGGDATLSLTTNFRTTPPVIAWINHVFGRLITYEPGSQPAYEPLDPAPQREPPPSGPPVVLLGGEHTDDPDAELLREREAGDVAAAVVAALGWKVADRRDDGGDAWRRAGLGDITILLPARTSLPALERALEERGIAYRAETSSLVYSTREVRELLAAVRALADPTDQLSLVTALRSPVFGCGDDDLVTYRLEHRGAWSLLAPRPDGLPGDHPVGQALDYLRRLRAELPWLAPSEVLDRIVRDRRLFELGYAQGRPRDLWRRLRFVIDQARAWSAAEGGTLRQYVEWARMQASESARVAETILPETDDDSVRIMTVHAAKGLEFPIAILSGMTTASRGVRARVQVAFPPGGPLGLKVGPSLVTPEFEQFAPIDEQMDHHERLRLLYVACTRARDHLVVSMHRRRRRSEPDEERKYTNAELIARASVDAPSQHSLDTIPVLAPVADLPPAPEPLPPMHDWEAERERALRTSGRRRTVGASDITELLAAGEGERQRAGGWGSAGEGERQRAGGWGSAEPVDDETAAGIAKGPRDLDLPPWQKGRYGTAIGRAVHGVLQTVDLATGDGLVEAAAAQAAAESVVGREDTVAALARAALRAPSVRESLRWRRWRETYVATTIGDRTLEGYVDLLYRTTAGLVVVDYKIASSSADLEARLDAVRLQGGAYAVALEAATGEPVVRVVFVFLTPDGAVERDLEDLDGARTAVRVALSQA